MIRSTAVTVLKIAVTALLLYLFVRRTDFSGVWAALSQLSFGLILALIMLNLLGVFLAAYKWGMLLPEAKFSGLAMACFASYSIALLLPGQVAQEAAKAYYLSLGESPRMHKIAASVVVDKIISIIGLLVAGGIGLALSQAKLPQSLTWLFVSAVALATVALFSLRASWVYSGACGVIARVGAIIPRQKRLSDGGIRLLEAWHNYSKDLRLLAGNTVVAVLNQFVGVLAFYLLSQGLHLHIGFFDWSWIVGALTLALFLPLTIGGIGVREGTLMGLLALYGCPKESAVALSFVAFSFVLMLAIIGAGLSVAVKASTKSHD